MRSEILGRTAGPSCLGARAASLSRGRPGCAAFSHPTSERPDHPCGRPAVVARGRSAPRPPGSSPPGPPAAPAAALAVHCARATARTKQPVQERAALCPQPQRPAALRGPSCQCGASFFSVPGAGPGPTRSYPGPWPVFRVIVPDDAWVQDSDSDSLSVLAPQSQAACVTSSGPDRPGPVRGTFIREARARDSESDVSKYFQGPTNSSYKFK